MKKVAIVILNWNGKSHLETFLPSVVKHSEGYDILVIDNASTDDSVPFLKTNYPSIQLISNPTNGGFAKGYNQGLEKIKDAYTYYVLLNSDVEVTPNWIEPIIERLDKDTRLAGAQPKILAYTNKNHFEHAGAAGGFIDSNGYPFCRGRIFSTTEKDEGQYEVSTEIFWATGACMFIRSEVFHALGGFDEDYFAHMEEIDLCWRAKLKGYSFYYCAESRVFHLGGGTLNYNSPRKVYLNFRNSLFTLYKNYQGKYLLGKMGNRFFLDCIALGLFLFKLDFKAAKAVVMAQIHFMQALKKLRVKRNVIQSTSIQKPISCVYNSSIVWAYFLFGKKKFKNLSMLEERMVK